MSILSSIEAEFATIMGDARSVSEKIEAIVGLQSKKKELDALDAQLTAIISSADPVEVKVEAIARAVGKL